VTTDDDDERRAAKGRTDRITFTGRAPIPGIPERYAAPRPASSPELDDTPPEPWKRRQQQQTKPGIGPSLPPPRKESPTPWAPASPQSTPLPSPGGVTPSIAAAADRVPLAKWLVIIGSVFAGATSLVMVTGQVIVAVLNASRPVTIDNVRRELDDRLKKVEARAAADWGLADETKARLEHEKTSDEAASKLEERVKAVENGSPRIQGLAPRR
jgi:hypothetical protein